MLGQPPVDPEILKLGKEAAIKNIDESLAKSTRGLFDYSLSMAVFQEKVSDYNFTKRQKQWRGVHFAVLLVAVILFFTLNGINYVPGVGMLFMLWALFVRDVSDWLLQKLFQKKTGYKGKISSHVNVINPNFDSLRTLVGQTVQNRYAKDKAQAAIDHTQVWYDNMKKGNLPDYPTIKSQRDVDELQKDLLGIIRYAAFWGEHHWKEEAHEKVDFDRICNGYVKKLNVAQDDKNSLSMQS